MTARVRMAENGAQLVSRLEGRQSLKDIEPNIFPADDGPGQGDVVEFHGMEGSGKTETLYHLITRCITPTHSGGLEVGVVFIDTDYHFDMLRFVSILEGRLAEDSKTGSENEAEETVRSCLCRLSVVHCNSSVQLLLTLHYLENTFSSQPTLGLLVIDSISAFYWTDRFNGGESASCQEANLRKCAELLDRLRRNYGIVIFATTHAIMRNFGSDLGVSDVHGSSSSSSSRRWRSADCASDFDRPYLCRAWQRIVTHRVLFTKSHAPKDHKQIFSTACTSILTKGVKKCSFCVVEDGIKFICDK
ncbi:DNA repair protein XRCC2 isoform 2 [Danio rerio]|uniref:DNA repair protein XRCC2 isoform 2 n=1 Tax=Danio rerio TaxID=7955 RepID=A0A2R8QRN2_DANRE|nr:DNA repair protein XRCC2 isoform 2 [Danio rerio]|eukprot:XP_685091.2 DNA repair protein XRCC2 [Danio rerio]